MRYASETLPVADVPGNSTVRDSNWRRTLVAISCFSANRCNSYSLQRQTIARFAPPHTKIITAASPTRLQVTACFAVEFIAHSLVS